MTGFPKDLSEIYTRNRTRTSEGYNLHIIPKNNFFLNDKNREPPSTRFIKENYHHECSYIKRCYSII